MGKISQSFEVGPWNSLDLRPMRRVQCALRCSLTRPPRFGSTHDPTQKFERGARDRLKRLKGGCRLWNNGKFESIGSTPAGSAVDP
jgi:hypothetical protein